MKISLCTLLTGLFVYLKLTHQIDWSWPWVVWPVWLPFAVIVGGAGVVFVGASLAMMVLDAYSERRMRKHLMKRMRG